MFTWNIPTPPSSNNIFANVAGKGRRKSETYKIWRQAAGLEILANRPRGTITEPVSIEVIIGDRRGDLDNRLKGPIDLLVYMHVIKDDSQVEEITESYGGNDPRRSIITVRAFTESRRAA